MQPEHYFFFTAGTFRNSPELLEIRNPFDGSLVGTTSLAASSDLEDAIVAALDVAESMKNLEAYKRYEALQYISMQLIARKEHLANILACEAAKPLRLARIEIERAAETFRIASEESKRLPGEFLRIDWTPPGQGKEAWVKYFPIGLVAGIAPFNFPMNLAVHKIAPAIAAGCPIILKSASSTPLSTLELARIIAETNLPPGAVSILPMDRQTGNQLVTDERFRLLTFTGSPEVGWNMKKQAGKKKVVLELGGNAGVIVSESANIDLALNKCLTGGYAYAGQVCIHTQRIYIHETIYEEFIRRFTEMVRSLKTGHPLDPSTDVSCMIDLANAIRVEQWVNEALAGGARLLAGGRRNGNLVEPVLLTNTQPDMKVNCEEVFGPVVVAEPYTDFSEAIRFINNSRFGLQAGVFTNHLDEMNQAFEQLEVGGVIINDTPTFRADHMPYGGVKDSGLGREGVKYAMLDMLEPRVLVK